MSICRICIHSQRRTSAVFERSNADDLATILVYHVTQLGQRILMTVTTTSLDGCSGRQQTRTYAYQLPSERAHRTDQCLNPTDDHRVSGQYDGHLHLSYTPGGLRHRLDRNTQ